MLSARWMLVCLVLITSTYCSAAASLACPANQVCLFYGITPEKTTQTNLPTSSFICPTSYPISQPYNPTNTQNQPRLGIQINTPPNTEIYAAATGKITQTPYDQNNLGTTLTIQHSDNPDIKTLYAHLKDTNNLRPGDTIKKGDAIGHSTNQLYFELDRNGHPTNEVQDICKNNKAALGPTTPVANTGECQFVSPIQGKTIQQLAQQGLIGEKMYSGRNHQGDDFPVSSGTTAVAVCAGTVAYSSDGYNGGYGGLIDIQCSCKYQGQTIFARYAHLKLRQVNKGDALDQGQAIGLTGGNTGDKNKDGDATGPHLHFEILRNPNALRTVGRIEPTSVIAAPRSQYDFSSVRK